ncbi:MAG TPA: DnaJ domain-containing protein [Clostridiaceae bacterium]|nr:DnaJ domain-containing protein [Clostridiaceae bacterium]
MHNIKDAYEVLGLSENATKEDIEKRYAILLKKYKSVGKDDKESNENLNEEFERITDAYNLLMGFETPEDENVPPKKPNPVLKWLGIDQKKFENFIHYYKFHILGGIAALVILISIINTIVTNVDPDLNVAFVGSIYYQDTEVFKEKVKDAIPDLNAVGTDSAILYEGMDGQMEIASNMKLTVLFAAAEMDVFITDKQQFDKFVQQGAFEKLDELAEELRIEEQGIKAYRAKAAEDEQEHIYGIDLTQNAFLKECGIEGEEIIGAVRVEPKHREEAISLIKYLINNR